jgi:hypothetical protein
VVTQYPDHITIKIPDTYEQDIDTGNFGKTVLNGTIDFDCRADEAMPADTGNVDGVETQYNFTIYAEPMSGTNIPLGSEYTLNRRGVTFTGRIKGFVPNQLNTVLWG